MSAMLSRAAREAAEAAGYTYLDEPERELLADILHRVLELVAIRRFEGGPDSPDLPLEKVSMIVELRERIRPPYSHERTHGDLTR
jgi:hypothetical protein